MVVIGEPKKAVVGKPLPSDHKLIEGLGSTETILKQFREHRERSQRLAAMVPELTQKYPDQWAALTEKGKLLVAPTRAELRVKFEELDTRPGTNAIEFLDTNPLPWAL